MRCRGIWWFLLCLFLLPANANTVAPLTQGGWIKVTKEKRSLAHHLPAILNRTVSANFIFDTGASISMIPYEVAQKLSLPCLKEINAASTNRIMLMCVTVIKHVNIGGVIMEDLEAAYLKKPSEKERGAAEKALPSKAMFLAGMNIIERLSVKYISGYLYIKPAKREDTYFHSEIKRCIERRIHPCVF